VIRALAAYMVAALTSFVVGSIAATQHVIGRLIELGQHLSFGERLQWAFTDLLGMLARGLYPGLIAIALAIAFVVAGIAARYWPGLRTIGFVLAGAAALLAMHLLIEAVTQLNPVAATRTSVGLMWQVLAGALGGFVFTRVKPPSPASRTPAMH